MNIKTIGSVAGLFIIFFFVNNYFQNKREARILAGNAVAYEQQLLELKNSVAEFQFDSKNDLESYLSANEKLFKSLQEDLEEQDIKLKNIRTIIATTIDSRDTIVNVIKIDSLYNKILNREDYTVPIEYSSGCFYIKAEINFSDGSSEFRSLEEKYVDTLTHVTSDHRKSHRWLFGFKSTLFSRKMYKITLFNSCGGSKTILIGGPKNGSKKGALLSEKN